MQTATPAIVDSFSALFTRLGNRQKGFQVINVGGEMCVAIPAKSIARRGANQDRGSAFAKLSTLDDSAVASHPHLAAQQRQYLSEWQSEMEDFDRF